MTNDALLQTARGAFLQQAQLNVTRC